MKIKKKTSVLIVDDSRFYVDLLSRGMSMDPGIEIVATAFDVSAAKELIIWEKPDVMTLDIEMPGTNGIEFLRELMPQYPVPTVVVSSLGEKVFEALNAGAIDFVTKANFSSDSELSTFINELCIKVKIASTAKVGCWKAKEPISVDEPAQSVNVAGKIIAIGASTGGTEALYELIKCFPKDMPGTVVVQHMPPGFTKLFAKRLNDNCVVEVKEAETGDEVFPGRVLIAPGGLQMAVRKKRSSYFVECSSGDKVSGHCPSVDVLFNSVADAAGNQAVGIILTGMGGDGAKGLLKMRQKHARTIGQNEKTCVVYGMPRVAYEMNAVEVQAPLDEIFINLKNMLKQV